ncbi:cell growth-regulating nucleolar protein [Hylaeus anthracinus]|uniref:cell growth-regulating nucleolar protein n=1 Tax=Hylaeus anthracinus TaxID=313031 RepID=UPI0023B88B23|nr:cell growth-regulating nucleolar protein [Hylaeus anthracinus]
MVVFTCNNCGETLQKPKVAKHYEFQCRTAPFLTCVDCFKDFRGEEYIAHTKCITEAQRYGGKDYVPKAGTNKGERKQQEWINIVNNILNSKVNLSNAERSFLNTLSKYENIPRKKGKFLNFVKNALGHKTNPEVVEKVWNIMETAYKNNLQTTPEKQEQENGKIDRKADDEKDIIENQENSVIENQNNENICKENQTEGEQNGINESHTTDNGTANNVSKKKKSKKRMLSETVEEKIVEPISNKKSESELVKEQLEESIPKKKSKSTVLSESSNNQCNNTTEKSTFDWKSAILDVVRSKGEISLKRLQKKVISRYMNFCSNTVTNEKASTKFNKKLKKISEIVISDEKVKLV